MLKRKQQSLSTALMLAVVAVSGCASKSQPAPACQPVKLPAWVLELTKQPSLIQPLDRIIEPYGLESDGLKAP